jgi:hypothetical protein
MLISPLMRKISFLKLLLLCFLQLLLITNTQAAPAPLYPFASSSQSTFEQVNETLQNASLFKKIRAKLIDIIGGGLSTFESFSIEGATFGLQEGIVSEVILGFSRSVEKNPRPTNSNDLFLVKDTLKIGLRLGLGVVLSGSAAYIHQFTLVYPVKSRTDGVINHGFILDFLLPLRVVSGKLPPKYVLMRESFIEGQARIRINGGTVPLGLDLTYNRVNMGRTIVSKKQKNQAQVYVDSAKYNELGLYFGFQMGLLAIPIQTASSQIGDISRYQITLDLEHPTRKLESQKALTDIMHANNYDRALEVGTKRLIESEFVHRFRFFTLLGFFTSKSIFRSDRITESHYDERDNKLIDTIRFQIEDRKRTTYNILAGSETHMSQVFLTAQPKEGGGLKDPLLTLTFLATDRSLRKTEIQNTFPDLINQLVGDPYHFSIPKRKAQQEHLSQEAQILIRTHFYPQAVNHLLSFDSQRLWARLVRDQGKSVSYWKRLAGTSYQDRSNKRMRNNRIPLKKLMLAKQLAKLIRLIDQAQTEKDDFEKVRSLTSAIRQGIYLTPDTFNVIIPSLLVAEVGQKRSFVEGEYVQFKKIKYRGPKKDLIISSSWGIPRPIEHSGHRFFFEDAHELYNLLP